MKNLQMRFITKKETVRWLQILNTLERTHVCPAQELAAVTQLSSRTIIREISHIRDHFGDTIEIQTNNSGYIFSEENYSKYHEIKKELIESDPLFIVMQSILENDLRTIQEWAFSFHFSESAMKRHLFSVVPILAEYEIKFSLSPVSLIGNEVNIRKFFKDFYFEVDITPRTLLPFESVEKVLLNSELKIQIEMLTNVSPSDIHYFFYIMILRSKNNKNIETVKKISYTSVERQFILELKKNIQSVYRFEITEIELDALFLYCVSQRDINDLKKEQDYCLRFNHNFVESYLTDSFISEYETKLFGHNKELLCFIEAFFISVNQLNNIGSIMHKNLSEAILFCKNMYPDKFEKAFHFLKINQEKIDTDEKYLESIAANLVFTVEAIRDSYIRNPRKIAFLLEGSYFVNRMIKAKVFRYLRGYHQIFFPNIGNLNKNYFESNKIDLFVTNKEEYVTELVKDIDFVIFKSFPDVMDWNQLLKVINPQIRKDLTLGKTLD